MGNNMQLDRFFLQKQIPYIQPFYSINSKDEGSILNWFRETDSKMNSYYEPLFREQKNNMRIFLNTGFSPNFFSPLVAAYIVQGLTDDSADDIVVNECYRLVMENVSLIVSNELVPQVLPTNDDYKDKIAAKIVKDWLRSMSYDLKLDVQRIKWEIQKMLFGEAFVVPFWNKYKGDLLEEAKKYANEELPLVDEEGHPMKDEVGRPYKIRKYMREGDMDLDNPMPWEIMIDPKSSFDKSDWFYRVCWEETAFLEKEYPKSNFKKDNNLQRYDANSDSMKSDPNHTKVFKFFHRSHPFLPEGRMIVCTENEILEDKTLEEHPSMIENRSMPLVRFLDLEMGVGSRGAPIIMRNIRTIVSSMNRLNNQIFNNLQAECPKLLVHETAGVDAQRMPTGVIAMEWRGNHEPRWTVPQTNTDSIFKFREELKTSAIEMAMSTPMVRGQTPNAQLDSFIALQHFEDQRNQLAAPAMKQHLNAMQHLFILLVSLAKDSYDEDTPKMIKILGKNGMWMTRFFDPVNLQKNYDITLTPTGNLANSMAAKKQLAITIKREWPNIISDQLFIDIMQMGSPDEFENVVTSAINSAQAENDMMLDGIAPESPARYEDLIAHWDAHRIPLQGREFKDAPPHIKMLFERHVSATEKLMMEQATESPMFAQRLATLNQFPIYYSAKPANEPPPLMGGEELGGVPEQETSTPMEAMESPPFNEGAEAPPADEGAVELENQLSPV